MAKKCQMGGQESRSASVAQDFSTPSLPGEDGDDGALFRVDPRYATKTVSVLGKRMAYVEVNDEAIGSATDHTIVFVHGNPTSKYMWRNVMPHCTGLRARLIAPDLIGMGESEKLENPDEIQDPDRYSLKSHCRFLTAFLAAVGVNKNVTLVGHSWGGTLVAQWGSENQEIVRGLVSMEVVYQPFQSWDHVPKKIRAGVKLLKREAPVCCCCCAFDFGAHLILKKNLMLESMSDRVNRTLTHAEMEHYRKGYTEPGEARRPMLSLIRSIPVAGQPEEVVSIMDAGRTWLETSDIPTLFLCVEPGTMMPGDRDFVRSWRNVTEVAITGAHMVTEDAPDDVGMAIAKWFREKII